MIIVLEGELRFLNASLTNLILISILILSPARWQFSSNLHRMIYAIHEEQSRKISISQQ